MGFINFCWGSFSAGLLACNGPIWQYGPLEYTGFQHIALFFGVLYTYTFMTPILPVLRQTQTHVDNFQRNPESHIEENEVLLLKAEKLPTLPFWI